MDNKGKGKSVAGAYLQTSSNLYSGSGLGKSIWTDDAVTNSHGGWLNPVHHGDTSFFVDDLHGPSPTDVRQLTLPDDPKSEVFASSSYSRSVPNVFAETIATQEACIRALIDPDQEVAWRLWRESPEALKNHYALDVEMAYSRGHDPNANAPGNSEFISLLNHIKNPLKQPVRLIDVKHHVLALSADPIGSFYIRQNLEKATTGEIVMLYNQITPHVHTLAFDAFPNYVIQKLLEYGPPHYIRKLIDNLMGHVFVLSHHLYGCQVIQKAFEKGDADQQIDMAMELGNNLLKCVCDQHASLTVQKCMECVEPKYIEFIYRGLCGKAKMLSTHPYGCHVIQKALELWKDSQIMHAFTMEILHCVNQLSMDPYGNYIVQHIVEHGEPQHREIIVLQAVGKIVYMSHQKHSSKVIQKCLIYGSYNDRNRIIAEILYAAGGRTADHLLDMMIHQYASYVVLKMIDVVNGWQFNAIADVVRRNTDTLVKYAPGRQVIAHVESILNAHAGV